MNWLERLCKERGVTRYQVSKATGISQQYLMKIVKDDIPMDQLKFCYYRAICEFFDIEKDLKNTYSYHEFTTLERVVSEFEKMSCIREEILLGIDVGVDELIFSQGIGDRSFELLRELSEVYTGLKKENFRILVCRKNE